MTENQKQMLLFGLFVVAAFACIMMFRDNIEEALKILETAGNPEQERQEE